MLLLFKFACVLAAVVSVALIFVMEVDSFPTDKGNKKFAASDVWECVCLEPQHLDCQCSLRASANVAQAAIRAPMLAMASAFIILLKLIPTRRSITHRLLDSLIIPFSAVTGMLAGWHWLSAETGGEPGRYVLAVVLVTGILVVALFFGPFLNALRDSIQVWWYRTQPLFTATATVTVNLPGQMTTWSRQRIRRAWDTTRHRYNQLADSVRNWVKP